MYDSLIDDSNSSLDSKTRFHDTWQSEESELVLDRRLDGRQMRLLLRGLARSAFNFDWMAVSKLTVSLELLVVPIVSCSA